MKFLAAANFRQKATASLGIKKKRHQKSYQHLQYNVEKPMSMSIIIDHN